MGFDHATATGLADAVGRFSAQTVLVLGDVMLDRYVIGHVRRISPEAPIPVLQFERSRIVLGGAGNVANNLAALGARAILIGVLGDDAPGRELASGRYAVPERVTIRPVIDPGRPTTMKTRFISGTHQILRLDEETTSPIGEGVADALLRIYEDSIGEASIVVLSDYAKGVLSDRVLARAIEIARAAGRPIVADPKRRSFAAYRHVSVLTPNEHETELATGVAITDAAAVELAGSRVLSECPAGAVLITRSVKGVSLVRPGEAALHLPAEAREVADVSGAGDTLVAILAAMIAGGAELAAAAAAANLGAGIAVGKTGTATVSQAELVAALHRREILEADDKTVTLDVAQQRVLGWSARGATVGFTNGCFDLIHPGHVRLLNKARARCDRLIVGLNTDASVKRLKGESRPLQNEIARATVLGSMAAVDLVILFDDDTPLALIEALRPNLLFKGADYQMSEVVGGDIVRRHGGEVVLIDLEQGFSTTGIIKRMGSAPRDAA